MGTGYTAPPTDSSVPASPWEPARFLHLPCSGLVAPGPTLLLDEGTHPPDMPCRHHLPKYNSMASMDGYFFTTRWLSMPSPCTMGSTFSAKCSGRSVERPHHCHWVRTTCTTKGKQRNTCHLHSSVSTDIVTHRHHDHPSYKRASDLSHLLIAKTKSVLPHVCPH